MWKQLMILSMVLGLGACATQGAAFKPTGAEKSAPVATVAEKPVEKVEVRTETIIAPAIKACNPHDPSGQGIRIPRFDPPHEDFAMFKNWRILKCQDLEMYLGDPTRVPEDGRWQSDALVNLSELGKKARTPKPGYDALTADLKDGKAPEAKAKEQTPPAPAQAGVTFVSAPDPALGGYVPSVVHAQPGGSVAAYKRSRMLERGMAASKCVPDPSAVSGLTLFGLDSRANGGNRVVAFRGNTAITTFGCYAPERPILAQMSQRGQQFSVPAFAGDLHGELTIPAEQGEWIYLRYYRVDENGVGHMTAETRCQYDGKPLNERKSVKFGCRRVWNRR